MKGPPVGELGYPMIGSKFRDRSLLVVVFLLTLAAILIGCGGNGGGGGGSNGGTNTNTSNGGTNTSTTGGNGLSSLVFTLNWPASTRTIPAYANCIVLTVQNGNGTPEVRTINRATKLAFTQQVIFSNLAAGTYNISGKAFLDFNAQGPVVSEFAAIVAVNSGSQLEAPITFASTISSVVIDGAPFFMLTGVTTELTGHAVDKDDNIMLLPPGSLEWSIVTGAEFVDLTPVGFLSAVAPGEVTVQLRDVASGQTATTDITVTGDPITTGSTGGDTTDTTGGSTTTDSTTTDGGTTDTTGGDTGGDTTGGDTTGGATGGTTGTGGTGTEEDGLTG